MSSKVRLLFLLFPLSVLIPVKETFAQRMEIDLLVGQYNHDYYINDQFNGIITQMSGGFDKENFLIGFTGRYLLDTRFELQLGFLAYTELYESMLFWDTTEQQYFGDWVKKAWTFGGGQFSLPLKFNYIIPVFKEFKVSLGSGIEYFSYLKSSPIEEIDLGRQHPRLSDFIPRLDKASFKSRLALVFTVGARYKRIHFDLQTRVNSKYSFSTFEFEGQTFQPNFWRKISSFTLSYNFLKLGN